MPDATRPHAERSPDPPSPAEVVSRLVRLAAHALDAPVAFAALTEPQRPPVVEVGGPGPAPAALTTAAVAELCRAVAAEGAPRIAGRSGTPPPRELGVEALIAVPLPEGVGALGVASISPRAWGDAELSLLADLAESAREGLRFEATERQLRKLTELAGVATWEWTAHDDGVGGSESLYEIWELDPSHARTRRDFIARIHPDDRGVIDEIVAGGHEGTGEPFRVEFRIVGLDGVIKWLYARGTLERDSSGRIVRVHGVTEDITEQRLVASRLETVESLGQVGSWEWEAAENRSVWSSQFYRIVGLDPATARASARGFIERAHPEERERARAALRAAAAGNSLDLTLRVIRADDGEVRTVRLLGEAPVSEDGKVLRMTGTIQDVTDRQRRETLLREAEERFGAAFESTSVPMALVDLRLRRFLRVNRALTDGLRRSEEELLGMAPLDLLAPDEPEIDRRAIADLIAGRRATVVRERRYLLPDGDTGVAALELSVVRDPDGKPLYAIVRGRDLTDQRATEEELAKQALHQPLTGLPNRMLFLDCVEHALDQQERRGGRVAVLALDIDRLREVNERFGFAAGDETIRTIAARVSATVRPDDTVGHLGEDAFAVAREDIASDREALELAEQLHRLGGEPIVIGDQELVVNISLGLATSSPGQSAEELMRDAELAAQAAADHGGDRMEVFDPVLRQKLLERVELQRELKAGIEEGELRVHYQPIVSSDGRSLLAQEALVRWEHPERGLLQPGQFLPVAEETGLDVPLGAYVLEAACRQAQQWAEEDPDWEQVALHVNVTAHQLDQPDFVESVAGVLERTGIRPERVRLEITETALMQSPDPRGILAALRRLGVRVILDDFGTGYSSLSHLRAFDVDELKIDRSFVSDIHTDAQSAQIVDAIISMARALSLKVVAEGVETSHQLAKAASLGCQAVQGFLISRPTPAEHVRRDLPVAAR